MDGAHALLVVLLVLDGLQTAAAAAALAHGRVRRAPGDHALASIVACSRSSPTGHWLPHTCR